jgi:phosphoribosylamine--glycine ligase
LEINALVIGSGAREHAIAWKLKSSKIVNKVFVAPGNGGTVDDNVEIAADDIEGLYEFAHEKKCLTVVGPETPLANGIVNRFQEGGLDIFGPTLEEARLETSKSYAKRFMSSNNIPTARYEIFDDSERATDYACRFGGDVVVKADGLAGGKGVFVCESLEEAEHSIKRLMDERIFGEAGSRVVIEEKLKGKECSIMTICDGRRSIFFGTARDHKRAFDDDKGPNTGGMGAFSPADNLPEGNIDQIMDKIARPVVRASNFHGFLYLGLMQTDQGPRVLEFNARLGDPETQVILPRLESDFAEILMSGLKGDLHKELRWSRTNCCTVVMCAEGYPNKPKTGSVISGLEKASEKSDVLIFHSGTRKEGEHFLTNGGRVLSVTGFGGSLTSAATNAYSAVEEISWLGEHHRSDIGRMA